MKKRILLILTAAGALIALGIFIFRSDDSSGKSGTGPSPRRRTPAVRTVTVSEEVIAERLELTGSVEAYRMARLASPAEGPVVEVRVREGDRVRAGDPLLSIGRKAGVAALIESLREDLRKEEDNLRRTRRLVESEALPGEELDQARAAWEKVRALLIKAEESARDHTIKAPWDGVVFRVPVREGEYVEPRAGLLEIYDPESLVIMAAVPERHAAEITGGIAVDLRLDAYPGDVFTGRVRRVYPYLDRDSRTRTVEIVPDGDVSLLPGMFARLKIVLREIDDAVAVPPEALVPTPEGPVVFAVEGGQAVARPVKTGIEAENRIQIISGLRSGDRVIVAGNEKLRSGMPVRLVEEEQSGRGKKRTPFVSPAGRKNKTGAVGR